MGGRKNVTKIVIYSSDCRFFRDTSNCNTRNKSCSSSRSQVSLSEDFDLYIFSIFFSSINKSWQTQVWKILTVVVENLFFISISWLTSLHNVKFISYQHFSKFLKFIFFIHDFYQNAVLNPLLSYWMCFFFSSNVILLINNTECFDFNCSSVFVSIEWIFHHSAKPQHQVL